MFGATTGEHDGPTTKHTAFSVCGRRRDRRDAPGTATFLRRRNSIPETLILGPDPRLFPTLRARDIPQPVSGSFLGEGIVGVPDPSPP